MPRKMPNSGHIKKAKKGQSKVAWADAVKKFHAHMVGPAECARNTIQCYSRDLDHFEKWWGGYQPDEPLTLESILPSDLREYKEFLRTEPIGKITKRTRMPASVNSRLACIKSFLSWAGSAGLIPESPMMPKRVKASAPAYKALPVNDQRKLLRTIEQGGNRRDYALVLTLIDCGLRVSEACALRWRDVELAHGKGDITVWRGKGGKHRVVPIGTRLRSTLRDYRGDKWDPNGCVFPSQRKTPLTRKGVNHLLEEYGYHARVEVTPHMLRHSCAKDMLDRGNQVTAVQAILGHESVRTTLGYLTSSPEDLRRAVERGGPEA